MQLPTQEARNLLVSCSPILSDELQRQASSEVEPAGY